MDFYPTSSGIVVNFPESPTWAGMFGKDTGNFWLGNNPLREKAIEKGESVAQKMGYNGPVITMLADGHSAIVKNYDLYTSSFAEPFDGVIFKGKGAAVFFPGGCPAIALFDARKKMSGLLHGSWRCVSREIIEKFLGKWRWLGGKAESTRVLLLPSICASALEYEKEYFSSRLEPLLQKYNVRAFTKVRGDQVLFDLTKLIIRIFQSTGDYTMLSVCGENECTCHSGKYHCYRCDDNSLGTPNTKYRNAACVVAL